MQDKKQWFFEPQASIRAMKAFQPVTNPAKYYDPFRAQYDTLQYGTLPKDVLLRLQLIGCLATNIIYNDLGYSSDGGLFCWPHNPL